MACENSIAWPQIVPWALVIIGWLVVNHQNNVREDRKEARAHADAFKRLVDDIESLGIAHHCQGQESVRCMQIKRSISRLAGDVELLRARGLEVGGMHASISLFRQSITLRNFDSARYQAKGSSDPIFAGISDAAENLRRCVELAYLARYGGRLKWLAKI